MWGERERERKTKYIYKTYILILYSLVNNNNTIMSVTHGKPGNHHKAYHVAGFAISAWHQRAVKASKALQDKGEAKLVDHTFETRDLYREWLFPDEGQRLIVQKHKNIRRLHLYG